MNWFDILAGQIPEALYFALFMIFTKRYKKNKIIFILFMILDYVLLFNIIPFSIYSHLYYMIIAYIIMRAMYKDKTTIADIFILSIASINIILCSFLSCMIFKNILIANIIQKIVLFILLFISRDKLPNIDELYKKLWNRGKIKYKMKSTTFRAINTIVFNFMFVVIQLGMIYEF